MNEHSYPSPEELAEGRTARAAAALAAWMEAGDREAHVLDALQDLVTDLGHLFDRCPVGDEEYERKGAYSALVAQAVAAYEEEKAGRE